MTILDRLPDVRGSLSPQRPMADLSWLRTGGPAEVLFQPADEADLSAFLRDCPSDIPVLPVGVCSNLIIRDGGIAGVVLRLGRGFNGYEKLGDTRVRAGAALLDTQLARRAARDGIDLSFLRTIPGTVGGAVRMNAGCYGRYVADVMVEARAMTRDGQVVVLSADEMGFAYRSTMLPDGLVLLDATFEAGVDAPDTIERRMEEALARRAETQPIKDRSCGSTFRNPAGYSSTGQADDVHDLKAWKLIEQAGMRGVTLGGAQMSPKHANFLVNTGDATATDLETLGEMVRKKVFETSGISLEWEIMRVGLPDRKTG